MNDFETYNCQGQVLRCNCFIFIMGDFINSIYELTDIMNHDNICVLSSVRLSLNIKYELPKYLNCL